MDNWNTTVVYDMLTLQHDERMARSEAAQRLAAAAGARPQRARLATRLLVLAGQLAMVAGALEPSEEHRAGLPRPAAEAPAA
ncbi:MAG: hypothetical protein ACTHMA_04205 [Thermomicrobiales bacterium]